MNRRRGQSGMQAKGSAGTQSSSGSVGGREFGNVVEPMQAQMASGNQGLADDAGRPTSEPKKPQRKKKAA